MPRQFNPSPPPEPTVGDTLENSVCSKHPPDRLNVHPWNVEVSTECGIGVVLALGPTLGNLVGAPVVLWGAVVGRREPLRRVSRPLGAALPVGGLHPSIATDGTVQGERYRSARGEILRSLRDPRQRRRSASARPSIKNESPGSKDDQTPS